MGPQGESPATAIMSPEALCDFYRSVLPDVYGYVLRLCAGDRATAEDLTQDVFVALGGGATAGSQRARRCSLADHRRTFAVLGSGSAGTATRIEVGTAPTGGNHRCRADRRRRTGLSRQFATAPPCGTGVAVRGRPRSRRVAAVVGRNVTATNSLLAHARAELRRSGLRIDSRRQSRCLNLPLHTASSRTQRSPTDSSVTWCTSSQLRPRRGPTEVVTTEVADVTGGHHAEMDDDDAVNDVEPIVTDRRSAARGPAYDDRARGSRCGAVGRGAHGRDPPRRHARPNRTTAVHSGCAAIHAGC